MLPAFKFGGLRGGMLTHSPITSKHSSPHMAANLQNNRPQGNFSPASERHLYPDAKNTVIYPGTVILLSGDRAGHETLFRDAEGTRMFGGFCASGEPRMALEYAKASQAMSVADMLKLEEIALQREQIALERGMWFFYHPPNNPRLYENLTDI